MSNIEYKLEFTNLLNKYIKEIEISQISYLIDVILNDEVFESGVIIKPSDFYGVHPWDSVMKRSECERIMEWLLNKLSEYGDCFRSVDFEEYKNKWGGLMNKESFEKYVFYFSSLKTIILFSTSYKEHYLELKNSKK